MFALPSLPLPFFVLPDAPAELVKLPSFNGFTPWAFVIGAIADRESRGARGERAGW